MNNNLWVVITYEYIRSVKRPGFIISTIALPLFMIIAVLIQAFSVNQSERLLTELSEDISTIYVVDTAEIINAELLQPPLTQYSQLSEAIEQVKLGEIDGVLHYGEEALSTGEFTVYAPENGLFGGAAFESLGSNLFYQSVLGSVENPQIRNALTLQPNPNTIFFDQAGETVTVGINDFILPGISFVIFFLSVFVSAQYLLQSVSEEKENRMIETLLSMIESKNTNLWQDNWLIGCCIDSDSYLGNSRRNYHHNWQQFFRTQLRY